MVDKRTVEGEIPIRLCNYTDVYYKDEITEAIPFMEATATPEEVQAFSLREGDVLITKDSETPDDIGVPAFVPRTLDGVLCGYHVAVIRPRQEQVDPKFLFWSLLGLAAREQFAVLASGVTRYGLRLGDVKALRLTLPDLHRQRAIAKMLDRETARLDGLIRAKQGLLELLHDRWRTEVVKSVTQGLVDVSLSPVDSPWFARIPGGWTLESLKRRWTVIDCKHLTPRYVDEGYPLVSHGEIEDGRVFPGRSGRLVVREDYLNLIEGRRPRRGDVIYTRNAAIGNAGYVDTDEEFAMGQDVCLITSAEQDQRFLTYFLNYVAVDQLAAQRLGATFGRINVAQIVDLQILCPPSREQRAIADHLDARREDYDTVSAKLRSQIELLAEHRQALITAAVTRQTDTVKSVA